MDRTKRDRIIETVNRLFVYTDQLNWKGLEEEVFTNKVFFDMTSMGAEKAEILTASQVCHMWDEGLSPLDAVHHQAGNYLIDFKDDGADVFVYSIASHYKKNAANGTTREFIGSYNLHLVDMGDRWRIDRFVYHLKYIKGNADLE